MVGLRRGRLEKFVGYGRPKSRSAYRALQQTLGAATCPTRRAQSRFSQCPACATTFRGKPSEPRHPVGRAHCRAVHDVPAIGHAGRDTVRRRHRAHVYTRSHRRCVDVLVRAGRLLRSTMSERPVLFAADPQQVHRLSQRRHRLPFPGVAAGITSLLALDWNHDFKMDLVAAGPAGVRLFLQSADGAFTDETRARRGRTARRGGCDWSLGRRRRDGRRPRSRRRVHGAATPLVLRKQRRRHVAANSHLPTSPAVGRSCGPTIDGDADPDAVFVDEAVRFCRCSPTFRLGSSSRLASLAGRGRLSSQRAIGISTPMACFDLVTLDAMGRFDARRSATWTRRAWTGGLLAGSSARQRSSRRSRQQRRARSRAVRSGGERHLAGRRIRGSRRPSTPSGRRVGGLDLDGDGRLDLVGIVGGRRARALERPGARAAYHWQVVRPRAQTAPAISASTRSASAARSRCAPACTCRSR